MGTFAFDRFQIDVGNADRADGKFKIDGWDTWFFDDVKNLSRHWPHVGANHEPPSTLWLGFLLYYAELFDFRQQVIRPTNTPDSAVYDWSPVASP